jgi:hypothetical protein
MHTHHDDQFDSDIPDDPSIPQMENAQGERIDFVEDHEDDVIRLESNIEDQKSLFENYRPRSISAILSAKQAMRDSEAAEAAAIILDGVEPQEFDFDEQTYFPEHIESHQALLGRTHAQIRIKPTTRMEQIFSPGAQFIYALLIITVLAGIIGLAATIDSPTLVLIAGIASPMLLPICVWKWIRWLDSAPYYYRLLTSLGEDARDLIGYRLLWKKTR